MQTGGKKELGYVYVATIESKKQRTESPAYMNKPCYFCSPPTAETPRWCRKERGRPRWPRRPPRTPVYGRSGQGGNCEEIGAAQV